MGFKRLNRAAPAGEELGESGASFGFALTLAWMRFHDDYAAGLEPLGLTPNRMLGLAYVVQHPGADQSSLGRSLGINRASAMSLIDKLQSSGLVRRDAGADRRSNALSVTELGESAHREGMALRRSVEKKMLEGLSEAQCHALKRLLEAIAQRPGAQDDAASSFAK